MNELLRAEIAELLLHEVRDPRVSGLVSVTSVEVTRDLSEAKVFVSVYGTEEQQIAALRGLERARAFLRREVTRRVKLRHSPELRIHLDKGIERGARILQIMRDLGLEVDEKKDEENGGEGS